jgi:hypothetical protein
MTVDFNEELRTAVATAASVYGPRDETTFELLSVTYHQKNYAQSLIDETARTIRIKFAKPIRFADNDSEAKAQKKSSQAKRGQGSQRSSLNSSTERPACRMIPRMVPGFKSRPEWQGTETVRVGSPGYFRT